MYRVQMKNSACVGCVHLLNFHLEAPFSRYISFLNICRKTLSFEEKISVILVFSWVLHTVGKVLPKVGFVLEFYFFWRAVLKKSGVDRWGLPADDINLIFPGLFVFQFAIMVELPFMNSGGTEVLFIRKNTTLKVMKSYSALEVQKKGSWSWSSSSLNIDI